MKIIAFCLFLAFFILCLPVNQALGVPTLDGAIPFMGGFLLLGILSIAVGIWLIDYVIHFIFRLFKKILSKRAYKGVKS